jgi:uncharacterized protein YacL (UPF0231 family)
LLSLKDIKFVSNDQQDYIRRLEREYEKQQKEITWIKERYCAYNKETDVSNKVRDILYRVTKELEKGNLGMKIHAEESICKCANPQREIKTVETDMGWVTDVFCRKCELPIYK